MRDPSPSLRLRVDQKDSRGSTVAQPRHGLPWCAKWRRASGACAGELWPLTWPPPGGPNKHMR